MHTSQTGEAILNYNMYQQVHVHFYTRAVAIAYSPKALYTQSIHITHS